MQLATAVVAAVCHLDLLLRKGLRWDLAPTFECYSKSTVCCVSIQQQSVTACYAGICANRLPQMSLMAGALRIREIRNSEMPAALFGSRAKRRLRCRALSADVLVRARSSWPLHAGQSQLHRWRSCRQSDQQGAGCRQRARYCSSASSCSASPRPGKVLVLASASDKSARASLVWPFSARPAAR